MDETLILRARSGESGAIAELYRRYYESVFRYLYYRVGDQLTAEDLTAEVFERMVRRLPRFQPRGAPFEAWLFRIARNLSVDYFRKMSKRQHTVLDERITANAESPERAASRSLASDQLLAALDTLTNAQREVIILRFLAEMPIAQVARVMGTTENAIKGLQRRGLVALRDVLSEWSVSYDILG